MCFVAVHLIGLLLTMTIYSGPLGVVTSLSDHILKKVWRIRQL